MSLTLSELPVIKTARPVLYPAWQVELDEADHARTDEQEFDYELNDQD